jgi:hypothetical protein
MGRLTTNFTEKELECPCCADVIMDKTFMEELQKVRTACGFPFMVNSGYRCESYNAKVSKNSMNDHTRGRAVDIHCSDRRKRARLMMHLLVNSYFKDIAIAKTFIHIGKGQSRQGLGVYG